MINTPTKFLKDAIGCVVSIDKDPGKLKSIDSKIETIDVFAKFKLINPMSYPVALLRQNLLTAAPITSEQREFYAVRCLIAPASFRTNVNLRTRLKKLSQKHGDGSTMFCPYCGNENLVLVRSFYRKECWDCGIYIPWPLTRNQKPLQ